MLCRLGNAALAGIFPRSDAIYYKLSSGEITVGAANKLTIESRGRFQTEALREHPDGIRAEEVQQQKTAEAMLQLQSQAVTPQPRHTRRRVTTTNCTVRQRAGLHHCSLTLAPGSRRGTKFVSLAGKGSSSSFL
jgi:hypothetical protein